MPQVNGPRQLLRRWAAYGWLLLLVSACGDGHGTDCLKSAGRTTTERRPLPAFNHLYLYDNVDVTLQQDTVTYAEVRTGKNLQEDIELQSVGNQLHIRNTSRCNWVRSYATPREVVLHTPQVLDMSLLGQGNLRTAAPFRVDTITFHLVGAGDADLELRSVYVNMDMYELGNVRFRGTATELHAVVGGSGTLNADELPLRNAYLYINANSNGNAHLNASNVLFVQHAGFGNLYYRYPTPLVVPVTGKGQAIQQ